VGGNTATESKPESDATKMAQRKVKWNSMADAIASGILSVSFNEGGATMNFPLADINPAIINNLVLNGLKQKLADSAAEPTADAASEYANVWANLTHPTDPKWTDRAEGSGPKLGLLLDAFIRLREKKGQPFATAMAAREALSTKRDAFEATNGKGSFRKALLASPEFAAIYAEVEAERDAKAPSVPAAAIEDLLD
jgi:hypothetical protein